jgi:subtilisin family serine protease
MFAVVAAPGVAYADLFFRGAVAGMYQGLSASPGWATTDYVPDEIVVKIKPGASALAHAAIHSAADAITDEHISDVSDGQIHRLKLRGTVAAALRALSANQDVAYAEPNYLFYLASLPNDPRFPELWGMRNTGQIVSGIAGRPGIDVRVELAWAITTGAPSVVVGVVDSGIDYNHPDLAGNVWSNAGGVGGCPAGSHGYNAVAGTCDPMDDSSISHGTHVAGTIGAVGNNGVGVVGTNWITSIMGLKAFDSLGGTTTANLVAAIDFAVTAKLAGVNVRVLNCSWGGGAYSQALLDEINKAGANEILLTVAAPDNASQNVDTTPDYPSSYHARNVVSVTAITNTDGLYGGFGLLSVDVGAPGWNILSTVRGGDYGYKSGTSQATPHVTGAVALLLSARPALSTAQLKTTILSNVDPDPALAGITTSGGRLNICRAMPGCLPLPPDQIMSVISILLY